MHAYTISGYYPIKLSDRETSQQVLEQHLLKFKQRKSSSQFISRKNKEKRINTSWTNESGLLPIDKERNKVCHHRSGFGRAAHWPCKSPWQTWQEHSAAKCQCWLHALPSPRIWLLFQRGVGAQGPSWELTGQGLPGNPLFSASSTVRTALAQWQTWNNEQGVNKLLCCTGVLVSVNVVSALLHSAQVHPEILGFIISILQQFLAPKGAVESALIPL